MLKKLHINTFITFLLKCLLISYIITAGLLLLLAVLLYKFSLAEKVVSIAIIAIYVIVTFAAGFLTGKRMETKKFIWGALVGLLYFLILVLVSFIANHSIGQTATGFITTLLLCTGGGMLGGMLS